MSKFGGFLARKPALFDSPAAPAPQPNNPLEIDEELFSTHGAQVGGENESLRNLLLDANSKIGELDTIKSAFDKLVDPVSKALRAYESEKSEKAGLQTVLNNTRTAYGKLRNEVADIAKKAAGAESECLALRQELASTQNLLKTAEATRAEIAIDVAARRAQIVELEGRLAQENGDNKSLREENRRLDERLTAAEKRVIVLESDINSARQRLLMAEDEKRAQQASLDRTILEASRLSRKLAETEAALTAAHGRLRHVEANFAEINTERHDHEQTSQRMRLEALQARATATEKLLGEARDHLLARAEDIRDSDRRAGEIAQARDALQSRVAELEADRIRRESELREIDQSRATLMERAGALARSFNAKESELGRATQTIGALEARIGALENEIAAGKQTSEQSIEDLNAALRREKLERAVVDGALETTRKDLARLMREVLALQRGQAAREPEPRPQAANAA